MGKLKGLIYSATIVSALLLVACEDTTEENVGNSVEEGGTEETSADVESEDAKDTPNEINQVITDDENVKATIIKMTKVIDNSGGNAYEILFEVENRRTDQIDVGYTDISGDGRPLSKGQSGMSATVIDPGATGQAKLLIYEDEEQRLPENLTMALSISKVNPDTPGMLEYVNDYPFTVTLSDASEATDAKDSILEINKIIADDGKVKITLTNITKGTHFNVPNSYQVTFKIETIFKDGLGMSHGTVSLNGQKLNNNQATRDTTWIPYASTIGELKITIFEKDGLKISELNSLTTTISINKIVGAQLEYVNDYPVDVTF